MNDRTPAGGRPPYVRPTLVRHQAGLMNKMGPGRSQPPVTAIGGVAVEELVAAHGSPLFVYDEQVMRDRWTALHDALARRHDRVALAWSHKTCPLDAVCAIYHQQGALAEVVSGMEYRKARRAGVPIGRIVYNGPHKDEESLREALLGGARVHIDHHDELAACERIAAAEGIRPKVGIRLNLRTAAAPAWDRFGFGLESGQAWDAVRRLLAGGQLALDGLHCHLGTFVQDPRAYGEAARKVVAFANRLWRELGILVDCLDLGGGFASALRLRSQYLPSEESTPSFDDYAAQITDALGGLDRPPGPGPLLLLETGRALIDPAGSLVCTVVAHKQLPDGRAAVVVDAGVNLLFTAFWYQHRLAPAQPAAGPAQPTMVYGPLCMNIDVVGQNVMLPPLPLGARIVISPVGAYNLSQSMQFIQLRPAVVLVGPGGRHAPMRRREQLDDLVGPECRPPWLDG